MNIGIDCGSLAGDEKNCGTGLYNVASNLLLNLSKIDKENQYLLYSFSPLNKKLQECLGKNFKNIIISPKFGWLTFGLSLYFLKHKPDLFIGLSQALPLYHPKSLVFVYDLAFEKFPRFYKNYHKLSLQTKKAVKEADIIITLSKKTKKDIMEKYSPSGSIKVVSPGLEKIFFPRSDKEIAKVKKKYKINSGYILYVGTLKKIKNIKGIVNSYQNLAKALKTKYQLVIAGKNDLALKIKGNQIKYLGYIKKNDLPALYSGARLFLSPSFYEGFCFPIIEAIACGCPVISSKAGAVPEILGQGGTYADPFNIDSLTDVLTKALKNDKLKDAVKRKYSWDEFGKKVYRIIKLYD